MTTLDDSILIGEGVRLEAGYAPVTLRVGSGLIDYLALLFGMIYVIVPVTEALLEPVNEALARAILVAVFVGWFVGVPTLVETLTRGLSLGRLATGIRIVRDDGGPVSFRHALTRALMSILEVWLSIGLIAVTVALLSPRGKRLGDYLAGTYPLRTRGGTKSLPPVGMPLSLVEWASTADMRRLPDGLALTARLFLGRTTYLRPDSRARLGNMIASEMATLVAPAPPAGTHPETFIAAVIATRRDREYALALRQDARAAGTAEMLRRLPHGVPDVEN